MVEVPLKIFQTAAMLEILHSVVGIVRSSVMMTCMLALYHMCIVQYRNALFSMLMHVFGIA